MCSLEVFQFLQKGLALKPPHGVITRTATPGRKEVDRHHSSGRPFNLSGTENAWWRSHQSTDLKEFFGAMALPPSCTLWAVAALLSAQVTLITSTWSAFKWSSGSTFTQRHGGTQGGSVTAGSDIFSRVPSVHASQPTPKEFSPTQLLSTCVRNSSRLF